MLTMVLAVVLAAVVAEIGLSVVLTAVVTDCCTLLGLTHCNLTHSLSSGRGSLG